MSRETGNMRSPFAEASVSLKTPAKGDTAQTATELVFPAN
jgi:hypothetical protein